MSVSLVELLVLCLTMLVAGVFLGSVAAAGAAGTVAAVVAPLRALARGRVHYDQWVVVRDGRDVRLIRDGSVASLWVDGVKVAERRGEGSAPLVADLPGGPRIAAEVSPDGVGGYLGRIYAHGEWVGGDRPTSAAPSTAAQAESLPVPTDPRWEAALHLLEGLAASSAAGAPNAANHFALALRALFHRLDEVAASEVAHAALGTPEPVVTALREEIEREIARVLEVLRTLHLQVLSSATPSELRAVDDALARIGASIEAESGGRLPRGPAAAARKVSPRA